MSKREKRLKKIRQNPKTVSRGELDALFQDYGFFLRQGKGSHAVYSHRLLDHPLVVAVHGAHVPAYIVKQVLAAIDIIIEMEKDESEKDNDDES